MKFFQKIKSILHLIKELGWVTLGQFSLIIGSLVLLRVLTSILDPNQFGQLALSLTIAGLVNSVLMGGIVSGITRYYSIAVEEQEYHQYLKACMTIMIYATFLVFIIAIIIVIFLYWIENTQFIALVLFSLSFAVLGGYTASLNGIYNAARHRSIAAFHIGLDPWLKIIFVTSLVFLFGASSTIVVLSYALTILILVISQLFYLKRLVKVEELVSYKSNNINWFRKIWLFSWPFILWGFFGWIQISSTRWAFQLFGTTADVGYFAVLSQIGYSSTQIVMSILISFLTPILYSIAGNAKDKTRRKNISQIIEKIVLTGLLITILATLFSALFHRQIIMILVSEEYWLVSKYLPILVLAGGIFGIAMLVASKHMSFMAVKELMPASIGSSIIGIFAIFIGVYLYSYVGAAFAMLIHAASYLVMLLFIKPANELIEEKNEF